MPTPQLQSTFTNHNLSILWTATAFPAPWWCKRSCNDLSCRVLRMPPPQLQSTFTNHNLCSKQAISRDHRQCRGRRRHCRRHRRCRRHGAIAAATAAIAAATAAIAAATAVIAPLQWLRLGSVRQGDKQRRSCLAAHRLLSNCTSTVAPFELRLVRLRLLSAAS